MTLIYTGHLPHMQQKQILYEIQIDFNFRFQSMHAKREAESSMRQVSTSQYCYYYSHYYYAPCAYLPLYWPLHRPSITSSQVPLDVHMSREGLP